MLLTVFVLFYRSVNLHSRGIIPAARELINEAPFAWPVDAHVRTRGSTRFRYSLPAVSGAVQTKSGEIGEPTSV